MDVFHPYSKYEIARLRHEERLLRSHRAQMAAALRPIQPAATPSHDRPGTLARLLQRIRLRADERTSARAISPTSRP